MVEVIPAIDCKRGWQIRTEASMGKHGMAGQGRDRGATPWVQECARTVGAGSGQATHPTPLCDLCALLRDWRMNSEERQALRQVHLGLQIVLVDGDEAMRHTARKMVQAQCDGWALEAFHPCGAAEALSPARVASSRAELEPHHPQAFRPDILLVGVGSSGPSRLGCVRELKALAPKLPVVVISGQADEAWLVQCCLAEADGWLIKSSAPGELAWAVSEAVQGHPVLCRKAQAAVMDYLRLLGSTSRCKKLSWREREIMLLVMRGATNKEISKKLGIDEGTVHWHLNNAFKKMDVHSRGEARREYAGVNSCCSDAF